MTSTTSRLLGAALAAGSVFGLLATPVGAGNITGPVSVTGVVACDPETGHQVVSWTLTNGSGDAITIDSATIDGSGLTTQGPIDATVAFTPTDVANGGTATGTSAATGDATGDYNVIVNYTLQLVDPTARGEVVLPGGCQQTTTTTSTTQPSTTTSSAVAAVAVAASPRFTG